MTFGGDAEIRGGFFKVGLLTNLSARKQVI
jgi:hypothetical protein